MRPPHRWPRRWASRCRSPRGWRRSRPGTSRCADKEAVDAYQDNQSRWAGKALGHALPGGEDGRRFWARYAGALRQIAGYYTDDATVAVFSHGAAIRVFSILATGLAPATRYERPLFNTGMVTLTGHPEQGWQL